MRFVRWLLCRLGRHELYVDKILSEQAGRYGCRHCERKWAVHHGLRAMVPWDDTFAAFYAEREGR